MSIKFSCVTLRHMSFELCYMEYRLIICIALNLMFRYKEIFLYNETNEREESMII